MGTIMFLLSWIQFESRRKNVGHMKRIEHNVQQNLGFESIKDFCTWNCHVLFASADGSRESIILRRGAIWSLNRPLLWKSRILPFCTTGPLKSNLVTERYEFWIFWEYHNLPSECLKKVRDIVGKLLKQGFRNSKAGLLGCAWSTMKAWWKPPRHNAAWLCHNRKSVRVHFNFWDKSFGKSVPAEPQLIKANCFSQLFGSMRKGRIKNPLMTHPTGGG